MAANKRTFLTLIDVLVSLGASVIIFAAWAKLTNQGFADAMLSVGMWTESGIFLIYAILEWVKPKNHDDDPSIEMHANSPLESMDKMLANADITPMSLKKLSEGFTKLGSTVNNIGEIGDVVKSTSDFSAKTKEATTAIGTMSTAFAGSAATMASFNAASESTKGFHDQVQVLTKNLGSLNTIYELELNESNNHLKVLNSFYGKMAQASEAMVNTVDDATKAKEQIGVLANNLTKLNSVYGNMLSAMQGGTR
ncbi:MAG TPA: gliding motility protein GldL [Ferruginibacter sp.]|jgi:gliding motility-associated protein GldL|nr:gliding motility protein GldL [Ferruginibacter sp.]